MTRWMVMSPALKVRLMGMSFLFEVEANGSGRRRHGILDRRPLHHLLMERRGLRKRLAPAAIGEAEVGVAEGADQRDLGDVERSGERLGPGLEQRKAVPRAVPLV